MTIRFDKNFYNVGAIKKAAKAYKNLACFKIKEEKRKINVELTKIDKDIKEVIQDEFCNYVLAEMKNVY